MTTVVFLGPSLRRTDARGHLEAEYRPPVKRGDLEKISGSDTVVIIDGEFGQSLSVTPKEILTLMDRGVAVIGASSMGALRAAELDSFGMVGVGWVYQRFKRSWIRQEDEVALSYAPHDLSALTIPLVDCAYWLSRLVEKQLISKSESSKVYKALKRVFFADRSEGVVFEVFTSIIGDLRLGGLGEEKTIPNIKEIDAREALRFVSARTDGTESMFSAAI